jgi:hypothetical protein
MASTVEAVTTFADIRLVDGTFSSSFGVQHPFNAGEEDELAKKASSSLLCQGWPNESPRLRRLVSAIAVTHAYWHLLEDL